MAQFYPPKTYPGNFYALAVCCPLFVVVNFLVTYWLPGQEQDIVCETESKLVVRSRLDTDRHMYGLCSTATGGKWKEAPLGQLFLENGTLRPHVLEQLTLSVCPSK